MYRDLPTEPPLHTHNPPPPAPNADPSSPQKLPKITHTISTQNPRSQGTHPPNRPSPLVISNYSEPTNPNCPVKVCLQLSPESGQPKCREFSHETPTINSRKYGLKSPKSRKSYREPRTPSSPLKGLRRMSDMGTIGKFDSNILDMMFDVPVRKASVVAESGVGKLLTLDQIK